MQASADCDEADGPGVFASFTRADIRRWVPAFAGTTPTSFVTFPRTKIQPPQARAAFVARGALQARLADALMTTRLVLLCAPAGYGKTMLLAHEVARLPPGTAVAWISVDRGDDLQRLLECMLAALEPYDPPWRTAPEALVARVARGSAEDDRAVAAEVINTLDACEAPHGVVALDDLHRADDPALMRFLDVLVARMSPRWTLAIASRTEPPLALARLRAADDIAEFRQLELQFARDEARTLAASAGLDAAIADRVFDRTQGWPAGLRIAVGAVRSGGAAEPPEDRRAAIERALRAGDRPMFEFLISEVLSELRPELAEFLLRVSVLPELDAARCATVAQMPNAAALLDEIERLGLFIDVVDTGVRTLRLHDLLREAMQQHLALRDAKLLDELRRRAASTEPDPVRRAMLLLDVGAVDEAAGLARSHVPALVATGGAATAQNLIDRFPAAYRERSPELWFVRGLVRWFHWDFAGMMSCMERAAGGFAARDDHEDAQFARAYQAHALISLGRHDEAAPLLADMGSRRPSPATRIMMLSGLVWLAIDTGRLRLVAPLVDEMVTLLARVDRIDLWYHTTPPHRLPGLPEVAKPLARHAALLLKVSGQEPTPLRALALFSQAWCALWDGRFADARALRQRARDDATWSGDPPVLRGHYLALTAALDALAGNAAGAVDAARERIRALDRDTGRTTYVLTLYAARIASTCSDLAALREMLPRLDAMKAAMRGADVAARTRSQIPVAAQLDWLEGRADAAVARWEEALAHEEEIDLLGQAAQTRLRLARALVQRGDPGGAAGTMQPVFERVRIEGAPGAALFATDALRDLAECAWGDALAPLQQQSLREWWAILAAERAPAVSHSPDSPTPTPASTPNRDELTARELEVLRHIADGDSNKLIARALDLSLHTVKRHVANILDKLGVDTRGQAAAWYRSRAASAS
jgi:LuxR family maltose regulon positive regulatory protein